MSHGRGQDPFEDVRATDRGFSIPELKWRELLFVGALRPDGNGFRRDRSRPMPAFRLAGLFPEDEVFEVVHESGRVHVALAAPEEAAGSTPAIGDHASRWGREGGFAPRLDRVAGFTPATRWLGGLAVAQCHGPRCSGGRRRGRGACSG